MENQPDFHSLFEITGADRKSYCHILERYVAIVPSNINDLEKYVQEKSVDQILLLLHDMKGSLSLLNIVPPNTSYQELTNNIKSSGLNSINQQHLVSFISGLRKMHQLLKLEAKTTCLVY